MPPPFRPLVAPPLLAVPAVTGAGQHSRLLNALGSSEPFDKIWPRYLELRASGGLISLPEQAFRDVLSAIVSQQPPGHLPAQRLTEQIPVVFADMQALALPLVQSDFHVLMDACNRIEGLDAVDPVRYVWDRMRDAGFEPSRETFRRLVAANVKAWNTSGVTKCLEEMEKAGFLRSEDDLIILAKVRRGGQR
ncbi:hypothetical protein BDK51DRAFT_29242 [Blyttiomyces helicus]|uniref:Pentacotripeptide-repeat region of PRORP domain-containing protein n=1 Tax=Blyttiomyces helicus TaxID=388810 RepID=A0A4P9VZ61_9FUNG|nr:hypothetical protein BDK51DRAFT_29242 [Blyttiomyces helicus]|eukprot:RKO83096.1 hypothetical protein BDK51DRAFT_29242 [Blyttiomyces helicus]